LFSFDLSLIYEFLRVNYLDAPIIKVNSADVPLAYASTLVQEILPSVDKTIQALKSVLYL